MSDSRWYFTEEQLVNSPSRKCGINAELELSYRQRAANLIQEMGQRLQVSQLCINTAIVYMHRFYAFHSFTMFHRNSIASAAFFLAAKVEEQPRKLEHVIKILNICLEKTDMSRETYAEQAQELVLNENILLQTLGFDVAIDHPHTHVVKACQLFNIVTVSRELRQTCYFMASNSLHLTTMCLKYRPTVVAAFCIYIACKWSRWEIPDSSEGKAWYSYVDENVTLDTLKKLTEEYLQILERSPSKFKSKMKAITSNGQAGSSLKLMKNRLQVNQSPGISDGPSTSQHKSHEKHHHHHHHKNLPSATNSMNVNANGNSRSSNSSFSTQSKTQSGPPSQSGMSASASSSSNHNIHRQRPPPLPGQQPYSSSQSNSSSQSKLDERSQQQRLMHQDGTYYNSSSNQRHPEHPKHRPSSNPAPPLPTQPPLPQSQAPPSQPYNMKMSINDQKGQHNLMSNSSKPIPPYPPSGMQDMHQKNVKQPSDYHGSGTNNSRNSSMNPQQIPNNPQKKPPWPQQSSMSQQQQQQQQHSQDKQYPHLQKNLQMSQNTTQNLLDQQSASNVLNSSKSSLQQQQNPTGFNDSMSKQQHAANISQQQQQNDFWFNDKINELSNKTSTSPPQRSMKSLFSPSPEHDNNERAKYMMMAGSLKGAVDSPKEDKKSTPTKRDKSMLANHLTQKHSSSSSSNPPSTSLPPSMIDKKFMPPTKIESNLALNTPSSDLKRSYSAIKDPLDSNHSRENKVRKVDQIKSDPSSVPSTPQGLSKISHQSHQAPPPIFDQTMTPIPSKQPIETNPDIVKSLLAECFSSNKYDSYDTDSPLDVINPEPPEELLDTTTTTSTTTIPNNNMMAVNSQQMQIQQPMITKHESLDDLLDIKDDKMDSSAGESSRKDHKKKSKKKKEKHKHKKKHKSSDREDNKSDSSSIKIILAKDGRTDSKSSPESFGGGLKIKIPINKDSGQMIVAGGVKNDHPVPAPIKLKISKEKLTNSNNNNNNSSSTTTSSSSSHHHKSKKDKDRDKSKSKSSKHYSSSSDFKDSNSFQHSNN